MNDVELATWIQGLEALAAPVIDTDDVRRGFVDEMGHRRAIDAPFLAWCGRGGPVGARDDASADRPATLDVTLWEGVARARAERESARAALRERCGALDLNARGPLTARDDFGSIEVWTETELGALHALWWLAMWSAEPMAAARVADAAAWHVAELQPDNGTNHPWALHVFLFLERERPGTGGRAHAEVLLQNCQVALGRPDLLSAYVLRDCARALAGVVGRPGRA